MPPSPALRCSPGRERRSKNTYKRGHSFESGLPLITKDDDLAMFDDMQNRERDDFLLHTSDDFDDLISKLRYFSDFKIDSTVPVRGESSDLLNVDGEKTDYDWLFTPPDTPLFPSLDDDECQPVNRLPRGRSQNQFISISRSSMSETTHTTSRSSASPRRLSPSPQSNNSYVQLRGRPSSAPSSSPPPILRPTTPSRRPSTPSTPPPRSSTPTLRRMSTGSSGHASFSGRSGSSPLKANRGNSASPKLRGWQTSLDGFSCDAPPNLRTSLSDRTASHTRILSPSSRNRRDSSLMIGRQSVSPTASRSASSLHSQERDHLSTYSKGSVASSGDDDVDSLHSVSIGISSSLTARNNGVMLNSKPMSFSKKPSRTVSAISAPKKSFDSAIRQMDHHKIPKNMFRPLLSSVPATTFYVGKVNSTHRPMVSRNSSLTTSSNTSSEQIASIAPDLEGSDHEHNDLAGELEMTQDPDTLEEIFIFDTVDMVEDGCEIPENGDQNFDLGMTSKAGSQQFETSVSKFGDAASITIASESSYAAGDRPVGGGYETMATCSICEKRFHIMVVNSNPNFCQECTEKDGLFTSAEPGNVLSSTLDVTVQYDSERKFQQLQHTVPPCLRVDRPEGAGISVLLLQTSSSSKSPFVQGRTLSATNMLCSEPSYARDSINAMKRSTGWDSASASSADMGSSRQTEDHDQCQLSIMKYEMDKSTSDNVAKEQNIGFHPEGFVNAYKSEVYTKSETEESFSIVTEDEEHEAFQENGLISEKCEDSFESAKLCATQSLSIRQTADRDISVCADSCLAMNTSYSQFLSHPESEDRISSVSAEEDLPENSDWSIRDDIPDFSVVEEFYVLNVTSCPNDTNKDSTKSSSAVILELENDHDSFQGLITECVPSKSTSFMESTASSEWDVLVSAMESTAIDHAQDIREQPTVTVEVPRGRMLRTFTLDEAADTILFCNSIIHDIAYKAAAIGMEKESTLREASRPTVTVLGNHFPRQKDSRKTSDRNILKSQKSKRKRPETNTKATEVEINVELDEVSHSKAEISKKGDSFKPPKLESKCNCAIM